MSESLDDKPKKSSEQASEMNLGHLTAEIVNIISDPNKSTNEDHIKKLISSLDDARASKFDGGKLPFHNNTKLHKFLMENSSDAIAQKMMVSSEVKSENVGHAITSGDILHTTPAELWPCMASVGEKIAKQKNISVPSENKNIAFLFLIDQFVEGMNELLEHSKVTDREMKEVISSIPSVLVDAECQELVHTAKMHAHFLNTPSNEVAVSGKAKDRGMNQGPSL